MKVYGKYSHLALITSLVLILFIRIILLHLDFSAASSFWRYGTQNGQVPYRFWRYGTQNGYWINHTMTRTIVKRDMEKKILDHSKPERNVSIWTKSHTPSRYLSRELSVPHKNGILFSVETEIFIGVNLGEQSLLAQAIVDSWGGGLKENVTVGFFACPKYTGSPPFLIKDASYPCHEYPPIESWLVTFKIMSTFDKVKWFLKCDDDSYVNVRELISFLASLERAGVRAEDRYYFGGPGYGRDKEKHLLGLDNASFAMGGPCVGVSAGAMRALVPALDWCMRLPAPRMHSDTQLGRCFRALNISLGLPRHTDARLWALFRHVGSAGTHLDGTTVAPFARSTVPPILPARYLAPVAITLHSVKDPLLMLRVHAQLHAAAVPIDADRARLRALPCVHSPAMARAATTCAGAKALRDWTGPARPNATEDLPLADGCSVTVKECPPRPGLRVQLPAQSGGARAMRPANAISAAYVICLRPAECVSGTLHAQLARLGLAVEAVAARVGPPHHATASADSDDARIRTGRASLAAVMRRAREAAVAGGGTGAVLVLEEAAVLRSDFGPALARLLARPRCGCQLGPGAGCPPGVLVLGPAAHRPAARWLYDAEAARHRGSGGRNGGGSGEAESECVNVLPDTHGGAGLVLAHDALPLALALLEAQPHPAEAKAGRPADSDSEEVRSAGSGAAVGADRVLTELALAGLVVRAAWPPLVLTDLSAAAAGTAYSSLRHGPAAADDYRRLGWDRLGFDPHPIPRPHPHPPNPTHPTPSQTPTESLPLPARGSARGPRQGLDAPASAQPAASQPMYGTRPGLGPQSTGPSTTSG
jgi:hypothetical protein